MEWLIFFVVVVVSTAKYGSIAITWLEKSEPQGPFRRPTVQLQHHLIGRAELLRQLQANRAGNHAVKRNFVEEKVNWKVEGF